MTRNLPEQKPMGLLTRLRAFFTRPDPEEARREWLKTKGRIVEGMVFDLIQHGKSIVEQDIENNAPCTILYRYNTFGVTYESSHVLSPKQLTQMQEYRVGKRISVRYDPRHPANSFVE